MRTYLLIANRTLGGPALRQAIADRLAGGPARFHVVVPAAHEPGFMEQVIDAYAGEPADAVVAGDWERAHERLQRELRRLRSLGADAVGEVGDADPLRAAADAMPAGPFDEVILSTLPAGFSHWLGRDLPRRLGRVLGRPITHVEGPAD